MSNIILIGFMGCGKTTFGKWIAANKGMVFCDTDELIEADEGRCINDIFAADGEEYFRELETECIKKLINDADNMVISVGGGLPVREVNRGLLKQLGTVVYLNTSKEELVKRLRGDKTRPLLKGGDLEQRITELMSRRKAIYEAAADIAVSTDNADFEQMYEQVCG